MLKMRMPHIHAKCRFNFRLQMPFEAKSNCTIFGHTQLHMPDRLGKKHLNPNSTGTVFLTKKAPVDTAHLHCLLVSVCLEYLYIFYEALE